LKASFQQPTARQHAQQVDHDENTVGVDNQRVKVDVEEINGQGTHHAAAQYGIQRIHRKLTL
ncbi:hypothetical protein EY05_14855, partial [Staphylococcus aureus]